MPCVGFEHTIPASERAKTVHALDRSSTVTGPFSLVKPEIGQKAQGFWSINETEWEEFRLVRRYIADFEEMHEV
jgi:hypothetical protein